MFNRIMYVMFQLRPFTVHNVFPCFYGPNEVIIIIININMRGGWVSNLQKKHYVTLDRALWSILTNQHFWCDIKPYQNDGIKPKK